MQIEDSASDSDICSECSTSDSDIPDIEVGRSPQAVVSCAKGGAGAAVALRRPTLVQQAAAATIQQHYRRYGHRKLISKSQGVLHNGHSAKSPVKAPVTAVAQAEAQAQHKHQAANCIQACWRQHVVRKALMAAPLTPPCSNSHMQSSCSSLHSSRPGSALSIGTSGLCCMARHLASQCSKLYHVGHILQLWHFRHRTSIPSSHASQRTRHDVQAEPNVMQS